MPARSPDLNHIEIFCRFVARGVYENREPYMTVGDLNDELNKQVKEIRRSCLQALYKSLPSYLLQAVNKNKEI